MVKILGLGVSSVRRGGGQGKGEKGKKVEKGGSKIKRDQNWAKPAEVHGSSLTQESFKNEVTRLLKCKLSLSPLQS